MAALMMPIVMLLLLILNISTDSSSNAAVTYALSNDTRCTTTSEQCRVGVGVGEEEEEENHNVSDDDEFMMDSEIRRMMYDFQSFKVPKANVKERPVLTCGRGTRYGTCLGQKRSINPPIKCSQYNRLNPC